MKNLRRILIIAFILVAGWFIGRHFYEQSQMTRIIERLQADSRVAEILVTGINYNEGARRNFTTIKFLEYDVDGKSLEPRYFTFPGNIIQFQSLVVRFDDRFVMSGDRLRGRSVYVFLKAFMLDGANTKEFPITHISEVPEGYRLKDKSSGVERDFWEHFWTYALDKNVKDRSGVKSVQIEAPGTMFVPGYLYTVKIEHDGGLRIDTKALPPIVRGEKLL